MPEVLKQILLAYLPAFASVGGMAAVALIIKRFVLSVISELKKKVDEAAALRGEVGKLNKKVGELVESNKELSETNEALKLELRGINPDEVKKRLR